MLLSLLVFYVAAAALVVGGIYLVGWLNQRNDAAGTWLMCAGVFVALVIVTFAR